MTVKNPENSMQNRYENAHKIMQSIWTKRGPLNTIVFPVWIGETDCFWYIRDLREGKEFRLVNAKTNSNISAFDHQQLASALADASGQEVDAKNLPFSAIEFNLEPKQILFTAFDKRWQFDEEKRICTDVQMPSEKYEIASPKGNLTVFSRDHNLWLRDLENGEEKALTIDGDQDYVYGGTGMAWGSEMFGCHLEVCWSPDSQSIFAVVRDTRQVKDLPIMQYVPLDGSIRPQVAFQKVAFPGDEHVETLRLMAIDVVTGKHQLADYNQIPVTRNSWGFFSSNLGWWNKNGQLAYFVDVDRYYKYARVVEFDTTTGNTKVLFEESSDTQINLMNNGDMHPSFVPLKETNELLWYSERTGWAHLYLYDLNTGQLKNVVTEGNWLVRDVVTVNPLQREVFIQTGCRTPGRNPYYRDLVRVNIDTGEMFALASSDHDYFAGAFTDILGMMSAQIRRTIETRGTSPTGNYSVVTQSRVNTLPKSLVVDREGNQIMTIEIAEAQGMPEGWVWPEPVQLVAADGKTDIWGVVYRPSDFSQDKSYPLIIHIFNTPDFPWASIASFNNNIFDGLSFFDAAALAELGFIVVQIDGRGGSFRSKAFKDSGYGNLQLPCMLADQVAGIKQIAEQYPYVDLSRVGITSHMGGGQGVTQGLLDYPEFFKVGITSFVHDSRLMSASMWGDMYEGRVRNEQSFPEKKIERLQGKLLLLGGMLDTNCPPAGIFRLIEALQKSNKDFDMLLLPSLGHDMSGYFVRRAWDYLVQHLMGEEPPKEFHLSNILGME